MKRLPIALALALFPACGDDEVKPGNLIAAWEHGGPVATCQSRGVISVEARLYAGTNIVEATSAPCEAAARSGTVALADVKPGSYRLVVEAIDANDKGLYLGEVARQSVREGKTTTSASITLAPKPATIVVDWTPPDGKCSSLDIKEVEIQVFFSANLGGEAFRTERVSCDFTFKDPETGIMRPGVLFDKLEPNDDVAIQVVGYDSRKKKVAKAVQPSMKVGIGDELEVKVDLVTCPTENCE